MVLKLIKEHWLFIIILVVCAVLRFIPMFDYQFTLDELSGLNRTRFDSFGELLDKGVKIDAHPLLIQVLIFCIIKLFGYVTWIIKLPFLLMSLGTMIYSYLFCIKNFSLSGPSGVNQAGIFASLIFGFSLIFVFYAPIARMYVAGVFFSIGLLFYFFEIFFLGTNKIRNYVFLGLFAVLSALNHHINALFALTLCISGLFFLNKSNRKTYLLTCMAAVICYVPTIPITLYQLAIGGIGIGGNGWLPAPEADAIIKFTKIVLGTGKAYIIFLILVIVSIGFNRKLTFTKKQFFLLTLFLVNYFIVYFYSVYRAPVFQYSVMLFSSVAFVLFTVTFIEFKINRFFYLAVVMVTSILVTKTYFKKDYLNQSVKTVFEYQFERTFHYKKLYGDKNVYPVFFDADEFMEQIYFEKYGSHFDCKISSDSVTTSTRLFSHFVANLKCDYLVLASSFPGQQAIAASYFPYLIENTQTQGINFKVYSKKAADKALIVSDDKILTSSDVFKPGAFVYGKTQDLAKLNNELLLEVDSLNEFPFDAKANYHAVVSAEGQMMLVKSTFKLSNLNSRYIETCISVKDQKTNENINYDSKAISDFVVKADSTVTVYVSTFFGTKHSKTSVDANVAAYIWNRDKDKFILKDFEIRIIDFCPRKWQLWD